MLIILLCSISFPSLILPPCLFLPPLPPTHAQFLTPFSLSHTATLLPCLTPLHTLPHSCLQVPSLTPRCFTFPKLSCSTLSLSHCHCLFLTPLLPAHDHHTPFYLSLSIGCFPLSFYTCTLTLNNTQTLKEATRESHTHQHLRTSHLFNIILPHHLKYLSYIYLIFAVVFALMTSPFTLCHSSLALLVTSVCLHC